LCPKALSQLVAGLSERKDGRKVRAAQDAPLLKVEAVGDSWIWKKRMTAHENAFLGSENENQVGRVRVRRRV